VDITFAIKQLEHVHIWLRKEDSCHWKWMFWGFFRLSPYCKP